MTASRTAGPIGAFLFAVSAAVLVHAEPEQAEPSRTGPEPEQAGSVEPSQAVSFSFWVLDDEGAAVQVQMRRDHLGLAAEGDPTAPAEAALTQLPKRLELYDGSERCALSEAPEALPATEPWVIARFRVACTGRSRRTITASFHELLRRGHRHVVRIDPLAGPPFDRVIDARKTSVRLTEVSSLGSRPGLDYLLRGTAHLRRDWEHAAFLVGLFLMAQSLMDAMVFLLGFGLAYGLSLSAVGLGYVVPQPLQIAALVGLSVAFPGAAHAFARGHARTLPVLIGSGLVVLLASGAGAVNRLALTGMLLYTVCYFVLLSKQPASDRTRTPVRMAMAMAIAFGLLHGLGHEAGPEQLAMPREELSRALFGLSSGLLLGGAVLMGGLWLLRTGLRRLDNGRPLRFFQEATAATLCGLGLFWFVTRNFT